MAPKKNFLFRHEGEKKTRSNRKGEERPAARFPAPLTSVEPREMVAAGPRRWSAAPDTAPPAGRRAVHQGAAAQLLLPARSVLDALRSRQDGGTLAPTSKEARDGIGRTPPRAVPAARHPIDQCR